MSPLRAIALLAAVAALVAVVDAGLARRASARRGTDVAAVALVEPARKTGKTVAAIEVALPGREDRLLYARTKGLWRCREMFGAVADPRDIEALIATFLQARGVVRTDDASRAAEYGFGGGDELVVSFHGPKVLDDPARDVIFSFDVGRSFTGGPRGTSFVRESGTSRILEIDRDPRPLLVPRRAALLPPLVDTRLLAGCTPPDFQGFRQFFVDLEDGTSLTLDGAAATSADAPAEWTLDDGHAKRPCPPWRIAGYSTMWFRAECISIGRPDRAREVGLDPPFARVTLVPVVGEPIVMALNRVNAKNELYVWNTYTDVVYVVEGEMQALLAPEAGMLLDESRPNPWERWLRK